MPVLPASGLHARDASSAAHPSDGGLTATMQKQVTGSMHNLAEHAPQLQAPRTTMSTCSIVLINNNTYTYSSIAIQ